jgi:hypothetical protein
MTGEPESQEPGAELQRTCYAFRCMKTGELESRSGGVLEFWSVGVWELTKPAKS